MTCFVFVIDFLPYVFHFFAALPRHVTPSKKPLVLEYMNRDCFWGPQKLTHHRGHIIHGAVVAAAPEGIQCVDMVSMWLGISIKVKGQVHRWRGAWSRP
jgi:hypothetical protein